jgi:hypothetical protein
MVSCRSVTPHPKIPEPVTPADNQDVASLCRHSKKYGSIVCCALKRGKTPHMGDRGAMFVAEYPLFTDQRMIRVNIYVKFHVHGCKVSAMKQISSRWPKKPIIRYHGHIGSASTIQATGRIGFKTPDRAINQNAG